MVTRYLIRVARELTDRAASEFSTRAAWEKVKEQRRLELLDMLGLNPLPARTPLNLRVTGVIEKGEYTIEKLAFESLPRIFATANLYLPRSRNQRVPAVIYVCGHSVSPHGSKVPVPASRHHLREAWIRLSDHRSDPDCRDLRVASWCLQPGDARLVRTRLHSGRCGGVERDSCPGLSGDSFRDRHRALRNHRPFGAAPP